MSESLTIEPIGIVRTPYPEKFSVPRQPGLVTCDDSYIELQGAYNAEEALRELDSFSHLWLIWHFHHATAKTGVTTVRPPRLGGNQKVGVFASRSPFRPNPLGLSVVKLRDVLQVDGQWRIRISGADLVDQTPLLDIKPYVPYSDAIPEALGGYAHSAPAPLQVVFSEDAQATLLQLGPKSETMQQLISEVLSQDPRPAFHADERRYYSRLSAHEITWQVTDGVCRVLSVTDHN